MIEKEFTMKEFKRLYPQIKNPTQEQITRAIMTIHNQWAVDYLAEEMTRIGQGLQVTTNKILSLYVEDNAVMIGGKPVKAKDYASIE